MKKSTRKTLPLFIILIVFLGLLFGCNRTWGTNEPIRPTTVPDLLETGSLFDPSEPTQPLDNQAEEEIPTQDISPTSDLSTADIYTPTDEEWLIYLGQFDQATSLFQATLSNPQATSVEKSRALLGLGRISILKREQGMAIDYFDTLINQYPLSTEAHKAYYFLGEVYSGLGNHEVAARAYENFVTFTPAVIDDLIYEKIGNAYRSLGQTQAAIEAYQVALIASENLTTRDELKISIAQLYLQMNDVDLALQFFTDAYNNTQNPYINAKVNLLLGQYYEQIGDIDTAYEKYQENINFWPYAFDSYTSLVRLVEAGQVVDEYQRGLTNYYAGSYGFAITAFNRYIESTSNVDRNGDVHYFNGLAYMNLEQYDNAFAQWQILYQDYKNSQYWSNAIDRTAFVQWIYLKNPKSAAESYLAFVADYPNHQDSPGFLYSAARNYERANELVLAAETWARFLVEYPGYQDAFRAQHLAAVSYYRVGDYDNTISQLNALLTYATTPEQQSAAYFWLGKTYQTLGMNSEAESNWQSAYTTSPFTYFGIRAEQVLSDQTPFQIDPNFNPVIDLATERQQAATWLRSTFDIGESVDLSAATVLVGNPMAARGDTLWSLGLYQQAQNEYEKIREENLNNALNTFRLIERLVDLGFYRSAAFASRHLLDLANISPTDFLLAPRYLSHLRYAVHYEPIISEVSASYNLPAQLIFSQIRQESLFDSRIGSSAGALGLMQIIPSTGTYINNQLRWDDAYETSDLYLPVTSINMGIYYIDLQRDYFDGEWFPALAAYNAGPGNAATWFNMAGGDIDLFVEIIRFTETRNYIQYILETYTFYSILYSEN
jgi:soluble lytic murein transglycosylase